ncbi:hypothetical protein AURDEDRAFT_149233 [Auricularia subglabra TFB-10046 SS5]|nr:hypothetical protein AURDEDRAFT_149233 [Auricularia subglabra TFB-10046 SS5]
MLRAFHPDLDAPPLGARQYSKTPARGTLQTKSLLKSENRLAPQTLGPKGKRVALAPQTPAMPLSAKPSKTTNANTTRGALQDKTPFQNRQTPGGVGVTSKKQKTTLQTPFQPIREQRTPPSSQSLPSATRTRIRAPARNMFETPLPSGINYWDISDGSIDVQSSVSLGSAGIVEEDFDEIEYMPPTAVVPECDPPFDVPDYKKLGADVKAVAHIVYFDDEASWDPHADFDIDAFLPPSPTTPTLLSSHSDSEDDRDLFPNVKRVANLPPTPPKRVVRPLGSLPKPTIPGRPSVVPGRASSRPTVRPSVVPTRAPITSSVVQTRSIPLARPSVVPARAPSRPPARPTAPTPGASRPAATSKVVRLAPAPPPRRATMAPSTVTRGASIKGVPTKGAPTKGVPIRPGHARSMSAPGGPKTQLKRPAVELVIQLKDEPADDGMSDFMLDLE